MIKPFPYLVSCSACGWQKKYAPKSDALDASDLPPSQCPKCQNAELKIKKVSKLEEALFGLFRS